MKNHDNEALKYVHRIVHDFDIKINGIKVKNVFNSAKSGAENGSEITVYEEYIKQHSK